MEDPFSVFRCRGIMNCVDVCPKGLNPTRAIGKIRSMMVEKGGFRRRRWICRAVAPW